MSPTSMNDIARLFVPRGIQNEIRNFGNHMTQHFGQIESQLSKLAEKQEKRKYDEEKFNKSLQSLRKILLKKPLNACQWKKVISEFNVMLDSVYGGKSLWLEPLTVLRR